MPVKLFVGNLSATTTTESLTEMFSEYGRVVEGDALGKFGFVHMETMEDAESAIQALNGHEVDGVALKVEISQGGKKDRNQRDGGRDGGRGGGGGGGGSTKLFVGNLNDDVSSDDLRDLFSQHGTVKEADAKGKYGFVHMSTPEEAQTCLRELKGAYIKDVAINVEISEERKRGGPGGGGGGGGGFRDGGRGGRGGGGGGPVKLFIGNMNDSISSDDMRKLFERAGTVTDCVAKGRYGFVHMATWEEGQNAIKLCNRHLLKGQTLNVEESSGRERQGRGDFGGGRGGGFYDDFAPPRGGGGGGPRGGRSFGDTTIKIFIGNLTEKTTTEDLIALFQRYGRVKESDSQACGKFGFIHMFYMNDAETAIYELNGTTLNGMRLNVELSQKVDKSGPGGPDRRRGGGMAGGRRDERPYDRPPARMEPPPRDAMAVAEYYQRTGRLPPEDLDRFPPRDPYSMYERERLAYDAYRAAMADRDPYRDPYRGGESYRTSDPYTRPPPEAYGGATKRFDEFDRLRERDYPAGGLGGGSSVTQVTRDGLGLTPEAAYAISRFAEADRYRASASSFGGAADTATRAAANGASDNYPASATGGSYSTGAYSSLYSSYNTR